MGKTKVRERGTARTNQRTQHRIGPTTIDARRTIPALRRTASWIRRWPRQRQM